jgi:serine/threonine protein kinase
MTLERGAFLHNRYRILEILGQGGMGSIYRAIDENLGVEVAVKENLFTTDEYARQFRREAIILANLRHSNLPRVSDHFVIDEQGQYLIMDYIEGEDLRERMDRLGVVSEDEILLIGTAICDALTYMHTRKPPVLHRDLKPGNVKITPQGEIFLVDFGLAKVVQAGKQTSTGARAMTPGYSPPEQYGAARTDHRSDIYSLGATMYAALVGVIPEDSLARTMDQAELTPIRKRNPKISRRTASVIEKALEVHPDDRYQNADEFKQALLLAANTGLRKLVMDGSVIQVPSAQAQESVVEDLPEISNAGDIFSIPDNELMPLLVSTPLEEEFAEPSKPTKVKSARGCLWTAAMILVVLVLGTGITYVINPTLPNQILKSAPPWMVSILPGGETPFRVTATPLPGNNEENVSTDSPLMVTSIVATATEIPEITFTAEPTKTPTQIATVVNTPTPTPTTALLFVPTPLGGGSGQIAFASDRTGLPQIWVTNIDGSGQRQITTTQLGACQPSWSPDGSQLVFTSPCDDNKESYLGSSLFIINADGSNMVSLPLQGIGDYDPDWSPDGTKIAFTSLKKADRPQIFVMDLETREVQSLSLSDFRDLQPSWSSDGSQIVFVSRRNGPDQLWVMNSDGSNQLRFSVSGDLKDTSPVLSPNGRLLVFTQSTGPGGVPFLKGALFPDGSEQEYKLNPVFVGIPMKEADFSPDGLWLALESWPDGAMHDIFIMAPNGTEFTQITVDPALDFDPAWMPIVP